MNQRPPRNPPVSRHRQFIRRVSAATISAAGENNLFFIEADHELLDFYGRTLCAFESAARHNKRKNVTVLIGHDSAMSSSWNYLRKMENLRFYKTNFGDILRGTSMFALWNKGKMGKRSANFRNNVSNTLRLALLLKFGGIYFDSDVISVNEVPEEPKNFAVAEFGRRYVNTAVLKFERPKHPLLRLLLENEAKDFRSRVWGHQGPILLSKTLAQYCDRSHHRDDDQLECSNFTVLPHFRTYPVFYGFAAKFFDEKSVAWIRTQIREKTFAVHYWNHVVNSWKNKPIWTENQPLFRLFVENCPLTYANILRRDLGRKYA